MTAREATRIDLHVHTRNRGDNDADPEETVESAIERGLDGIAVTEHYSFAYYDWIVPSVETAKDKCRLGVRLLDSNSIPIGHDVGDGNFTVQPVP